MAAAPKGHAVTRATLLLAKQGKISPTAKTMAQPNDTVALYAESLRQYLALRLGSAEDAEALFCDILLTFSEEGAARLAEAPGPRAQLFKEARRLVTQKGMTSELPSIPWRETKGEASYASAIQEVRKRASDLDVELLELHFTRQLSTTELAFIYSSDEAAIKLRVAQAAQKVCSEIGEALPVDRLPQAFMDAFALMRLSPTRPAVSEATSKPDMAVSIGTILGGRYKLASHIGSGGFAEVYRATDSEVPGHQVALKVLHRQASSNEEREAALRELHIIASVFHPSIVQFKDHGWHEGRFWFAMPWYEGQTLESRLDEGPLTRAEAKSIFIPLARALSVMHASGIRHQDVKPDNIFLARLAGFGTDNDILPVLLDLGVAAKEAELVVAGTPDYFAPEVAAQFARVPTGAQVSSKADIFSLALTLRNALDPNMREDVAPDAIDGFIASRAVDSVEAPTSSDLKYLKGHFSKWMHPDPTQRPTADDFADELSILTAPEEKRKRLFGMLKVMIPIAIAVLTVVGVTIYELNSRAEESGARAEQALTEADEAKAATLVAQKAGEAERIAREEEEARSRDLKAAAEDEKARSKLNRQELLRRLRNADSRRNATLVTLRETTRNFEAATARANTLDSKLKSAEQASATLQTQLTQSKRETTNAQSELNAAEQKVSSLQTQATQAAERSTALQRQLGQAQAALQAANNEKRQVEQQLAATTRDLRAAERRARRVSPRQPALTGTPIEVEPTTPTRMRNGRTIMSRVR